MKQRRICAWAAVLVVALLSTACGGGGAGDGARDTLNITVSDELSDLTPFTASQKGKGMVFDAVFTPLVGTDDKNEVVGRLAQSWKVSDDAKSVTFTLTPGLTWSDGQPITSHDVVWSLTQYLNSSISPLASRIGGVTGQADLAAGTTTTLAGLSAPDDTTVVVSLDQPNVAWANNLAALDKFVPILPAHSLENVPAANLPNDPFFSSLPVASGPYQLVNFTRGQYVELKANPHAPHPPAFQRVFMKILDSDTAVAQLRSGETQFIAPVSGTDVGSLEGVDGVGTVSKPGVSANVLQFNMADPLLADPRVRQAIVYAIDRKGICEQALSGHCSVPETNLRQLGPPWAITGIDGLTSYDFDPDKARQLLAEAGWKPGTTLVMLHRPGQRDLDTAVNILQSNLADVGITVQIQNTDTAGLLKSLETHQGYQLFTNGGGVFTTDPNDVASFTRCSTAYPKGANTSQYCDPRLDPLFDEGLTVTDQSRRAAIYHQIFTILNQSPAEVSLYVPDTVAAFDAHLHTVAAHGNISSVYWNIGDWTWQ